MKEHLEHLHAEAIRSGGKRLLMAAVVDRAVRDIAGYEPPCDDSEAARAMAFVLGNGCREICIELGADYGAVLKNARALYRRRLLREIRGTA